MALISQCHFASETRNRDKKIGSCKAGRKLKLYEVRAAGLRMDAWLLTCFAAEVLREVRSPSHGERLLARLLQVTRNRVKEEFSHLYLAGGHSAPLALILMSNQKLRQL